MPYTLALLQNQRTKSVVIDHVVGLAQMRDIFLSYASADSRMTPSGRGASLLGGRPGVERGLVHRRQELPVGVSPRPPPDSRYDSLDLRLLRTAP